MKSLAKEVEKIIGVLGESQDRLEEMAYELLNDMDVVKNHNEEMFRLVDLITKAGSEDERKEAIGMLQEHASKVSEAMEILSNYIRKNEEASAEQRKYVEETKQAFDFLWCFLDRDKNK